MNFCENSFENGAQNQATQQTDNEFAGLNGVSIYAIICTSSVHTGQIQLTFYYRRP